MWYLEGRKLYGKAGYLLNSQSFNPSALEIDLKSKIFVVTGANAGLGKSTAFSLAQKGATVHMVCRNEERGKKALDEIKEKTGNENLILHIVDMSLEKDVRELAKYFRRDGEVKAINGLVNNAGVMLKDRALTIEGHETTFITMANGTFLLTSLLTESLEKGAPSRVVDISSGGMYTYKLDVNDLSADDNGRRYDGTVAYAAAKRAQVILSEMQAAILIEKGISVNSMHPGWAATPGLETAMPSFVSTQGDSLRTSEEGSDSILWLLISPESAKLFGKFVFDRQAVRTHMGWTEETQEERKELWNKVNSIYSNKK